MSDRNRAEGWQYAKLSGHENEDLVMDLVMNNSDIQMELLRCAGKTGKIIGIVEGGLCEKDVPSVLGDGTKSKPDLKMKLDNGEHLNISIKKSWAGQVFLIQPERFMAGFEAQYKKSIPGDVKRALLLYFGKAADTIEIINEYSTDPSIKKYELHKWRLTKYTMDRYDRRLSSCLIEWFRDNIVEIFDFCFVRGLAKNEKDWADVIWYKNLLPEEEDPDTLFDMQKLKAMIFEHRELVEYGNRNGGSTIQLPFGFLQYHNPPKDYPSQNCMQFHHKFELLSECMLFTLNSAEMLKSSGSTHITPLYTNYKPGCIPLYTLRAACGYFGEGRMPEEEGWVDATGLGFTPDPKHHFVVHAKGDSMLPKIKDGDLCVFEWYTAGSREGEIVLSQISEFDDAYDGRYTIKCYHSTKKYNEYGNWEHATIQLQPLNRDFKPIDINEFDDCRVIGIFKCTLK